VKMAEKKRVGGRHLPPNVHVIGRTETAKVLDCSKSTTWRMEERGELSAALKVGGVSWFDRATVLQLALKRREGEREVVRRAASGRRATPKQASRPVDSDNSAPEYRPRPGVVKSGSRKNASQDAPSATPVRTSPRKPLPPVPEYWVSDEFVPTDELPSIEANLASPPSRRVTEVPAEWQTEDFKTLDEMEGDSDEGPHRFAGGKALG